MVNDMCVKIAGMWRNFFNCILVCTLVLTACGKEGDKHFAELEPDKAPVETEGGSRNDGTQSHDFGTKDQEGRKMVTDPRFRELFSLAIQNEEYNPKVVAELREFENQLTDQEERKVLDLLILACESGWGSPVPIEERRERLEKLSQENHGTWLSAYAKMGILATYNSTDSYQQRIDALHSLLDDPGLLEFSNTSDPYISLYLQDEGAREVSEAPKDFALFALAYEYTVGCDLQSAEEIASQIRSELWKSRIAPHLDRLRQLDPADAARQRAHFLDNQIQPTTSERQ